MPGAPHLSFVEQTLHYFSRPHGGAPNGAVVSPAAWTGDQMRADASWRAGADAGDVDEIDAAINAVRASGKALNQLRREDFPLPRLAAKIATWREDIEHGRGFQVISGFPADRWGEDGASIFFWCLGLHIGRPGAQNRKGDLLGHVRDTGADKADPFVRQYMTTQDIPFHCDAADIVGLFCLRRAKAGGRSRIASSVSVFNELRRRRPDLAPRLFEPFMLDTRDENAATGAAVIPVPPCQYANGVLRTFYHAEYFRTAARHPGVTLSAIETEILDLYDAIAASPDFHVDMDLEPGDIQLLSNHQIIHARTDYEDYPDPGQKRHLLRLWLSLEKPQ